MIIYNWFEFRGFESQMAALYGNRTTAYDIGDILSEGDISKRHKIPISEYEIVSMMKLVLESRSISPKTHPQWKMPVSTLTFNFVKSVDNPSGVLRSRSWIRVPNIPPQVLFYCIYDCETRRTFDKYYVRFEASRVVDACLDVLISEVRAPVGVSNREFVEWRRTIFPEGNEGLNARYGIQLRSCDDSECSKTIGPSKTRVERAEVWLSGYVFQWWLGDDGSVKGSEIMVMSQVDWGGSIPKLIINNASADGPSKWSKSLIAAAEQVCRDKNLNISMSNDTLQDVLGLGQRNVRGSS